MELTRAKVKGAFDERSFQRGYNYFRKGYVIEAIKFPGRIWGRVTGSRPEPYRVSVSLDEDELQSECSCPVGHMCKHGVALALYWIERPESFMQATEIIESLRGKNKEELIVLIENILLSNPALISKFELAIQKTKIGRAKINLKAIEKRVAYAISSGLDYYHIDGAVEELWEIWDFANSLKEKSKFMDAAEVYMCLVEGCTNAYDMGADDSNGSMGEIAQESVSMFNECMEKVDDQGFKDAMLLRVAELYEREGYGLGTEDMFLGVATETNIKKIEDELNRQLENYLKKRGKSDRFFSDYKRGEVKEILTELYEKIGRTDDALELAQSEMRSISDHVFATDILIRAGKYDEALGTLRKCSKFKDFKENYELADAYLKLVEVFVGKGLSDKIDLQEAIEFAMVLIVTRPWSFNREEYDRTKSIFQELGAQDFFTASIKEKFASTSALVRVLLHENDVIGAAETLASIKKVEGTLAIQVAIEARSKGLKDLAMRMTSLALRSGYSYPYGGTKSRELRLIRELLTKASKDELNDIVLNLKVDNGLSVFIGDELAVRAPELVRRVLKEDIEVYETSKLMHIVDKLAKSSPSDARHLGVMWISRFVVRSHVYYDDTIKMLKLVKKAIIEADGETDWDEYISSFEMKYKTRKKLMEKLRAARLI